jgi:hypothetical protein
VGRDKVFFTKSENSNCCCRTTSRCTVSCCCDMSCVGRENNFLQKLSGQGRELWIIWHFCFFSQNGSYILNHGVWNCTQVINFVPCYINLYSGAKFCTQVHIFILRCEILYPGVHLCTNLLSFVPRCIFFVPRCTWCTSLYPVYIFVQQGVHLCTTGCISLYNRVYIFVQQGVHLCTQV